MAPSKVPIGWHLASYGEVLSETDERAGSQVDLPVLSVTKTRGPMLASERFGKVMHGRDLTRYRIARHNQIVADPMLLWDGSIGLQEVVEAGLVSPDYRVYQPGTRVDPKFMGLLVRSPSQVLHYQAGAKGTNVRRNRIARSDFLEIPFVLPPLGEQRKIAAILASVDHVIGCTQGVISQFQAVRTALLAELLTRGLPGRHTRFKQTSLGEFPASWEVVKAQDVLIDRPRNGCSPPSRSAPPGVPTFSIGAVRHGQVNIRDHLKYAEIGADAVQQHLIQHGDVLIVRGNGNAELVGTCGMVRQEPPRGCIYPDTLMRIKLDPRRVDAHFFVPLWNSALIHDQILNLAKTTNGIHKVNGQDVRSVAIPVPALDEQRSIGVALDSIDEARRTHQVKLTALLDLRNTLTTALLTGDVRTKPSEETP